MQIESKVVAIRNESFETAQRELREFTNDLQLIQRNESSLELQTEKLAWKTQQQQHMIANNTNRARWSKTSRCVCKKVFPPVSFSFQLNIRPAADKSCFRFSLSRFVS